MPRRPLTSRACVVAGAVAVLVAVPAGWAGAEPLVPGGRWATTVDLPDAWAGQADTLGVTVAQLRQQENGCTRPEVRAGDTTCGADEGDLAGQVLATVAGGRYADGGCVPTSRPQPLDLTGSTASRLAVTGPECLVVVLDFPDGDDDDLAQSDTLGFTLSLVAGGPGGGVTSGGTAVPGAPTDGGTAPGGSAPGGPGAVGGGVAGGGGGAAGGGAAGPAVGGTRAGVSTAAGDVPGADGAVTPGGAARGGAARGGPGEALGDVGSTTADVEVGARTTEAGATRTFLGGPLAYGALLLGLTVLFWLLFLVLRRRRREQT